MNLKERINSKKKVFIDTLATAKEMANEYYQEAKPTMKAMTQSGIQLAREKIPDCPTKKSAISWVERKCQLVDPVRDKKKEVFSRLQKILDEYREEALSYFLLLEGERAALSRESLDELLKGRKEVFARPVLVLTVPFSDLGLDYHLVEECLQDWLRQEKQPVSETDPRDKVVEVLQQQAMLDAKRRVTEYVKK